MDSGTRFVGSVRSDEAVTGMDEVGFDQWVAPHLAVLRAVAVREIGPSDADDLVQDALIRAWRRRSTYRVERGSAKAWLVAVLLDQLKRRRLRARPFRAMRVHSIADRDMGSSVESRVDVEDAIRRLPRRQREVVTLFYLADLTVEDVARVLGLKEGSIKSHLFDARTALRAALESS